MSTQTEKDSGKWATAYTLNNWEIHFIPTEDSELNIKIVFKFPVNLLKKSPPQGLEFIELELPNESTMGFYRFFPVEEENEETGETFAGHQNFMKYSEVSHFLFSQFGISLPDVSPLDELFQKELKMDFYYYQRWIDQMRQY